MISRKIQEFHGTEDFNPYVLYKVDARGTEGIFAGYDDAFCQQLASQGVATAYGDEVCFALTVSYGLRKPIKLEEVSHMEENIMTVPFEGADTMTCGEALTLAGLSCDYDDPAHKAALALENAFFFHPCTVAKITTMIGHLGSEGTRSAHFPNTNATGFGKTIELINEGEGLFMMRHTEHTPTQNWRTEVTFAVRGKVVIPLSLHRPSEYKHLALLDLGVPYDYTPGAFSRRIVDFTEDWMLDFTP